MLILLNTNVFASPLKNFPSFFWPPQKSHKQDDFNLGTKPVTMQPVAIATSHSVQVKVLPANTVSTQKETATKGTLQNLCLCT